MNPPYPSDAQAKAEILDAGRKIYQRGLVAANDGNLSVRVGDNALWVTPTGVSKGAMTEDMLVKLSLDGTVLEGTRKPSSETKCTCASTRRTPPSAPWCMPTRLPPPHSPRRAFPWTALSSRRLWCSWAPCLWPPLPCPVPRRLADSVAPYCQAYRAPAAGIPRRGHLGNLHGAGPLPFGMSGTAGHRHPPPADFGHSSHDAGVPG